MDARTKPIAVETHPLKVIGVKLPEESLLVLPARYIDLRRSIKSVLRVPSDEQQRLFEARVVSKEGFDKDNIPTRSPYPRKLVLTFRFQDAELPVTIFGATFGWAGIKEGDQLTFISAIQRDFRWLIGIELQDVTGRAKPIYAGVVGKIAGDVIERCVQESALDQQLISAAGRLVDKDKVAKRIIGAYGYSSSSTFLFDLHRPLTPEHGWNALSAAREVCIEQVRSYSQHIPTVKGVPPNIDACLKQRVHAQPEVLTQGQRIALNEIRKAFNARCAARVLINGDVGSGKTLVFLLAAASVCDTLVNGHLQRAAIMVPSELVARQIFEQCKTRFLDLAPALVCAGAADPSPESRLLIGTQSLLHLKNIGQLGVLVIDEQHKFSVEQRSQLASEHTHIIEASATPIPRSLAMALFDGWTEAPIRGNPVAKTIRTHLVDDTDRSKIVRAVHSAIGRGEKVIFLYSSVSSGESSCTAAAKRLQDHFGDRVGMVHGKLKSDAKEAAMQAFRDGVTPILVASSVIEVGVDIPGITVMVVNQSDRFGAAQLHQIRGRLVRSGGIADFFLLVNKKLTGDTRARLESIRDNNDGFALAERDLEIRGFGELLGDAQSGATDTFFKLPRLEPADFVRK